MPLWWPNMPAILFPQAGTITGANRIGYDQTAMAYGQATTASASDTIVTGLSKLVQVVAVLDADPTDTCDVATSSIGDQAGTPAAGSFLLKTWKVTTGGAAGNPTLIAATAFSKKVNWIAWGLP
jgi:hypothetical protein